MPCLLQGQQGLQGRGSANVDQGGLPGFGASWELRRGKRVVRAAEGGTALGRVVARPMPRAAVT
jgi:hypothetical protein